jgi:predicted component of type VI protein secretion system
MPAQLIALTEGPNILLDKPILLLGRHPECDIQIESRKISRRHCCIAHVENHIIVRDLGSTNGIRINGIRVHEGELRAEDELTIGNSRYRVQWETVPPIPAAAPVVAEAQLGMPPRHKAVRPTKVDLVDDAVLESCEEPVPLDEPAQSNVPAARPARPPEEPDVNDSIILPEHIELAPLSDVVPPQSGQ